MPELKVGKANLQKVLLFPKPLNRLHSTIVHRVHLPRTRSRSVAVVPVSNREQERWRVLGVVRAQHVVRAPVSFSGGQPTLDINERGRRGV